MNLCEKIYYLEELQICTTKMMRFNAVSKVIGLILLTIEILYNCLYIAQFYHFIVFAISQEFVIGSQRNCGNIYNQE